MLTFLFALNKNKLSCVFEFFAGRRWQLLCALGHTFPPTLKPRFPVLQLGSFSQFFLTFLRSFAVILR